MSRPCAESGVQCNLVADEVVAYGEDVRYAELNAFRMFYREGGSGDPLVFIHGGFAGLARTLKNPGRVRLGNLDHFFAARFRYLSYDRRGCRLSSCPDGG